jgi:hypothetical protein
MQVIVAEHGAANADATSCETSTASQGLNQTARATRRSLPVDTRGLRPRRRLRGSIARRATRRTPR